MEIERTGSRANFGKSGISLNAISAYFNPRTDSVVIYSEKVIDFNGRTPHNYEISISLEEVEEIINSIGKAIIHQQNKGSIVKEKMSGSLQSLIKIIDAIAG
jgi:hypothetical protein